MRARFEFRPLSEDHIRLLFEWLQQPHVRAWWDSESTIDEVREHYLVADDLRDFRSYIAFIDNHPVAYIQSYLAIDAGDGWWTGQDDRGIAGMDLFIGDADHLGRGLGAELIREFTARLFADARVTCVQVDPSPDNARAIRTYERAGFHRVRTTITPDGPALLLQRERLKGVDPA